MERRLVDKLRMWRVCDLHVCRRERRCVPPDMPCEPRHREDIRHWFRTVYIPFLRERWPTVHWGAPAGQVQLEYRAAVAAEAANAALPGGSRRRRRRKRRPRRPSEPAEPGSTL